MSGDELEQTAAAVAISRVDRDLVSRDLERLAGVLTPLMLARLASLRTWRPRLGVGFLSREIPAGELLYDRLRDYLAPTISGALGSLAALSDGELVGLCGVVAAELGAWCRAVPPLTDEQLREAAPAMARLLGTLEEAAEPIDWSEAEEALRHAAS